jgi:hypothetical protein
MSSIEQCIDEIAAVRQAAVDPKAAYVIRSRIERLLLSCARLIAERSHQLGPEQPSRVGDTSAPRNSREIAKASDALSDVSSLICRPSESLDSRWDEGWSRIEPKLDQLEKALASQRGS